MFVGWQRERAIRRALRGISRQRVVVAVPGAPWVVENAARFEGMAEALLTCHLRGWVEVLHENVPHATLPMNEVAALDLSRGLRVSENASIYRLTEAGWAALNRTHAWLLATFLVSLLALAGTIGGLWLQTQQTSPAVVRSSGK